MKEIALLVQRQVALQMIIQDNSEKECVVTFSYDIEGTSKTMFYVFFYQS